MSDHTTLTELEQELAQREESAQTILSMVAPALEELKKAREALEAAAAQYVTRTEVQTTLVDGITEVVNRRFDELSQADEARHDLLVKQTEARFALTATKEELAGAVNAGAENSASITAIKASQATWQMAMEARVVRLESGQRKQAENIQKISQNTTIMKDAVEAIQHTFSETLERDKKRQTEVDTELAQVKEEQTQVKETLVKDGKAIRDVESAVRSAVDLAEDVDRLVSKNYQTLNFAILGNKETKTPGLVGQVADLIRETRTHIDELREEQKKVKTRQDKIDEDTWWLASIGRHPWRTVSVLVTVLVLVLITIAGIFGRPDIVEAIVRGAK